MLVEKWDELQDKKPLIEQLVSENKWSEIQKLIPYQKRYDLIKKYKSAEKISFGLAKGYLNVFDIRDYDWYSYLKDYFLTKYPEVNVIVRSNSHYNEYTYKDTENKLGSLNLNERIHIMNVDTRSSNIYNYMLSKARKEHNMDINMYSCVSPRRPNCRPLLHMKRLRLFQHIRYNIWRNDIISNNEKNYDFIIN